VVPTADGKESLLGFPVEALRKQVFVVAMIRGAMAAVKQHVTRFAQVALIANGN
jgi:hypothetical protein